MTTKSGLQRRQHRPTLFAQGGQIATNARKSLSSSQAAEAAGDFLLHLDHAQISLGQIIVKIHAQILQEGENGFLLFAQAIEQIARVTRVCIAPVGQGEPWPAGVPDPLHRADAETALPNLRPLVGPDAICPAHAPARSHSSYPAAGF